jgi:hypothetical protein
VEAIGAALPGASWQRCRTHYAANLMSATPKSSWPLHQLFESPKKICFIVGSPHGGQDNACL